MAFCIICSHWMDVASEKRYRSLASVTAGKALRAEATGPGCTQLSEEDSGLGERVLKNYIRLAESQRKSLASVICPRWPDHCVRFNPYTNLLKY